MKLNEIVAISASRTPMAKFGGSLKNVPSFELGATVLRASLQRAGISGSQIDDVILGCCRQAGNGPNPARTAAVKSGIPISVPAVTINMACPSGMRTVTLACQAIVSDEAEIVLAGGFDSMSSIPYLLKGARWEGFKTGDKLLEDGWSDSIDPLIGQGMGATAENLCDKYKIGRKEQDEFAATSHQKALRAQENGWFSEEVVSVAVPQFKKAPELLFSRDETIRHEISLDRMAQLPPAFKEDGSVTAGNSCQMSDGAAALLLTHRSKAEELGVKPLFSIMSYALAATDPAAMGEGPALTIPTALEKAGLTLQAIDLIEVNEAFAVQILANERVLKWDRDKLNVHGGAIALGHPTGISGARILVTMYYALKRLEKEFGVAAICGAGGVSMAMVIKRET